MSAGRTKKKSLSQRFTQSVRGKPKDTTPVSYAYGDIVILGMAQVGKTAIADRFVNNYYTEKYEPTYSQKTYEVTALLECEKENEKKMVMKKSFKKSIMGNSRPPLRSQQTMKMKSVVSVNNEEDGGQANVSRKYEEGKAKGLKSLKFNLVDTPADMPEMEEISYQASLSNAKGFILVCSFDIEESLEYIEERFADINNARRGLETPIIVVANKHDLDVKNVEEIDISTTAARMHVKWCVSSMMDPEGCAELSSLMLSEINIAAEQEQYLNSLPEEGYQYVDEQIDEENED